MKEKRYENQHDVSLRLHNTVLKYKEDYYFAALLDRIRDRNENGDYPADTTIGLHSLKEYKLALKVDANDPDLDITSLPLGYCEGQDWKSALFLARVPYRRQKQGIGIENVVFYMVPDTVSRTPNHDHFKLPGFEAMLRNKYVHYQAVLRSINSNLDKHAFIARPFSRQFCVIYDRQKKQTVLQHNLVDIGEVDLKTTLVQLYQEHNHSVFSMKLADLGVTVA